MKTRFEKAQEIVDGYTRDNRQKELAKKFGMSIADVSKVLQLYDFSHTKHITQENRNEGQCIKPLIFEEQLDFLDKYDF